MNILKINARRPFTTLLLSIAIVCAPALAEAQLSCLVKDSLNTAIPYVNAYLPAAGKGVLSDENGYFSITTDNLSDTNTVIISCLNYQPVRFTVRQLRPAAGEAPRIITLREVSYDAPVVEVRGAAVKFDRKWLGVPAPSRFSRTGYNASGRGNERAVLIENDDRCRLDEISIFVSNVKVDSFDVEVNIYGFEAGEIQDKLQKERIFVTIRKDQANSAYSIPMGSNVIFIDGSFLVATTMLNDLRDVVAMLEASPKKKYTGFRHQLDGRWVRTADSPSISVLLSCPD